MPEQPLHSPLGVFMKEELNPAFSSLSFVLFHATNGESDAATTAKKLAGGAATLAAWPDPPVISEEAEQVFYEYARGLERDSLSLFDSVRAGDHGAAAKKFETLRKKCESCHHFFRLRI